MFAAPAVMVSVWGGPLSDFIRMQGVGVATFIAAVASALSLGSVAVLIGLRLHEAPAIAR